MTKRMTIYGIVMTLIIIAICSYHYTVLSRKVESMTLHDSTELRPIEQRGFDLDFVPKGFVHGRNKCGDLFKGTAPAKNFSMSAEFRTRSAMFLETARKTSKLAKRVEGFSHQVEAEYKMLHYFASNPSARRICETGFNLGHSSFAYLTASSNSHIYSFDLGKHPYSEPMAKYLTDIYGSRLTVTFGDSTVTVPKFSASQSPDFRCDMILVDGGHNYPVARADIENFAKLANLKNNIIIFDDYPTQWGVGFGKGWQEAVTSGIIQELFRCTFAGGWRGFVIGKVVRHP